MDIRTEIKNKTFDEERSLYNSNFALIEDCKFSGPKDGESPLKRSRNIQVKDCFFDLRYSFWHIINGEAVKCKFSNLARAPFWYCRNVGVKDIEVEAVKAFRECFELTVTNSTLISEEPFWKCTHVVVKKSKIVGFYAFFGSNDVEMHDVTLKGKYSFQYIYHLRIENCNFDTKDAFWHCRDVVVLNSVIKGEYIGWYCTNITFVNCTIESHQPFCYANNVRFVNCKLPNCDLAFENSTVSGSVIGEIESIKNPKRCNLEVGKVNEIIKDYPYCRII